MSENTARTVYRSLRDAAPRFAGAMEASSEFEMALPANDSVHVRSRLSARDGRDVPVTLVASIRPGIPGLSISGVPEAALVGMRANVRTAIRVEGFDLPRKI